MLLGVVADAQTVTRHDLTRVRLVQACKDSQQGGFARTVKAQHHDLAALVDRKIDVGEDLERSVALAEVCRGERRLSARCRIWKLDLGHPITGPFTIDPYQQALSAPDHVVR